jgi:hypothetical protein
MNKLILFFFYFPNNGSLNKEYIVFYEKAIVFYIYHTFKIWQKLAKIWQSWQKLAMWGLRSSSRNLATFQKGTLG